MPDQLKALTSKLDKANARRHRLTGEPVLPASAQSAMLICLACRKTPERAVMLPNDPCPSCAGQIVEIVR